jgi:hypothetical protein
MIINQKVMQQMNSRVNVEIPAIKAQKDELELSDALGTKQDGAVLEKPVLLWNRL